MPDCIDKSLTFITITLKLVEPTRNIVGSVETQCEKIQRNIKYNAMGNLENHSQALRYHRTTLDIYGNTLSNQIEHHRTNIEQSLRNRGQS